MVINVTLVDIEVMRLVIEDGIPLLCEWSIWDETLMNMCHVLTALHVPCMHDDKTLTDAESTLPRTKDASSRPA